MHKETDQIIINKLPRGSNYDTFKNCKAEHCYLISSGFFLRTQNVLFYKYFSSVGHSHQKSNKHQILSLITAY